MSYAPAAATIGLVRGTSWPVNRSLVAGDSCGDLRYARAECREVARQLGTEAHIGPRCTRQALEEALHSGPFDVVHLAVHGRSDTHRGRRAAILLAADDGVEWMSERELAKLPWHADLVVFSGCSTGVSGRSCSAG